MPIEELNFYEMKEALQQQNEEMRMANIINAINNPVISQMFTEEELQQVYNVVKVYVVSKSARIATRQENSRSR